MISKNYIFKPIGNKLEFIGDFESLYKNEDDPWSQSGDVGEIRHYYEHSRTELTNKLKEINPDSLLEIGCGLGYTTKIIQKSLPSCSVMGMDISKEAISRARKLFPDLDFISGDIRRTYSSSYKKYDVIILNQLLWYVLESLSKTFENCFSLLNSGGRVIISQAFLKTSQKYGKDICDGFNGLMSFLKDHKFDIEYFKLDNSNSLLHNDGLIVFKKELLYNNSRKEKDAGSNPVSDQRAADSRKV